MIGRIVLAVCVLSTACSKKSDKPAPSPVADDDKLEDHPSYRYLTFSAKVDGLEDPIGFERRIVETLGGNNLYPVLADGKVADLGSEPPRIDGAIAVACTGKPGEVYTIDGRAGGTVLPTCEFALSDPKGREVIRFAIEHVLEKGEWMPAEYKDKVDIYTWSVGKYFSSEDMMLATSTLREALDVGDERDPPVIARMISDAPPAVIAFLVPRIARWKPADQAAVLIAAHDIDKALAIGAPALPHLGRALWESRLPKEVRGAAVRGLIAMNTPEATKEILENGLRDPGFYDTAGQLAVVELLAKLEEWEKLRLFAERGDAATKTAGEKALAARPK